MVLKYIATVKESALGGAAIQPASCSSALRLKEKQLHKVQPQVVRDRLQKQFYNLWRLCHRLFGASVTHSNKLCSDLLLDEGHDADSGEDWLPAETFPWDAIGKGFSTVSHRFAQVPHKKGDVGSAEKNVCVNGQ